MLKKWWFWVIVIIVVFCVLAYIGKQPPSDLIDLPEEEYRAECKVFLYEDIFRNPDTYNKELAKFTGEVFQVMRDGNDLRLLVNVTKTAYGYEDTIYVYYDVSGKTNILEGDIITIYGELRGLETYESVLGTQITIPLMYAKFIDINE